MDRLQIKCSIAAVGFHLLLGVILLVGPAFLSSKSQADNSPILDVIPGKLIDAALSDGGNPTAKPPPPAPLTPPAPPTPPARAPEPPRVREPEPPQKPVEEVKPAKPDPNSLETNNDHKRKKPQVSLTEVTRRPDTGKTVKTPSTTNSAADSEDRRLAAARRRAADLIGQTARSLRDDVSPGITSEAFGPGGGGEAYASYDQVVRSIYWHAWTPPEDTASDNAITRATVTIASDGTVLSARIIKPSGDASVDKSVERTLERVTFIAPFPEGAKDKQRTYTIKFDLNAKRLT